MVPIKPEGMAVSAREPARRVPLCTGCRPREVSVDDSVACAGNVRARAGLSGTQTCKTRQAGQSMTGAMRETPPLRVAVLMTCHNRKDATIHSLHGLKAQQDAGASMELFLVDDGSSDGTSDAV